MNVPPNYETFWQNFEQALRLSATERGRFYDVCRVGQSEKGANDGAALILSGRKTATSSLLWEYEFNGTAPPQVGSLSILLDGADRAVGVFETTRITQCAFSAIDDEFAARYGEGGGTAALWKATFWPYFVRECAGWNREPSEDMPVLCEYFHLRYPTRD